MYKCPVLQFVDVVVKNKSTCLMHYENIVFPSVFSLLYVLCICAKCTTAKIYNLLSHFDQMIS